MDIITISREFGSGGRELGKRLADLLGWDYYDRQIISQIAENCGVEEAYLERIMEKGFWSTLPISFRRSLAVPASQPGVGTQILLEQRRVILEIAKTGRNCIIVGQNADVILKEYDPLRLFVCADMDARVQRCLERAREGEKLSARELKSRIRQIDTSRARSREIVAAGAWGEPGAYHLTINTTGQSIKTLSAGIGAFADCWFRERNKENPNAL